VTITAIDTLIAAQSALIAALDAHDAGQIERATQMLATAVVAARNHDVWHDSAATKDAIHYAMKQSEAARIRVNSLSDWTRQRIDRIADLRGMPAKNTYANICNKA
jgi:hypothetical protein